MGQFESYDNNVVILGSSLAMNQHSVEIKRASTERMPQSLPRLQASIPVAMGGPSTKAGSGQRFRKKERGCCHRLDGGCNSIVLFSLSTVENFYWANKAEGNEKHAKFKKKRKRARVRSLTYEQETNVINYSKCGAHRYLILGLLKIKA